MKQALNRILDHLSDYFAKRKGLLPLLGALLVFLSACLQFFPEAGIFRWALQTDLFLHLGVLIAILGFLLAWAL